MDNLTVAERILLQTRGELPRLLFIIAGPSGVGKNTIIKELLASYPDQMDRIRTYTTRQKRDNEVDGEQYHFVTKEQFKRLHEEGKLLEDFHDVYGLDEWYSMPADLYQDIAPGRHLVIAEVDVVGAERLRKAVPGCITIFVTAPPLDLIKRIIERPDEGMTDQNLKSRMDTARKHISAASGFDYLIFNEENHLCRTVAELRTIIEAERMRVRPGVDLEKIIPSDAFDVSGGELTAS